MNLITGSYKDVCRAVAAIILFGAVNLPVQGQVEMAPLPEPAPVTNLEPVELQSPPGASIPPAAEPVPLTTSQTEADSKAYEYLDWEEPPPGMRVLPAEPRLNRLDGPTQSNELTIFRTSDKAERNSYISRVVRLQNAPAFEMYPHVLRAVLKEKGSARSLKYKNPDTGKTEYYMQVVTSPEQMDSIVETIRALDIKGLISHEGNLFYNYRLKYRRASEVATILRTSGGVSSEGKVGFDNATNTIYIEDSPSDAARAIAAAQFYDVPPPQVKFDILAVEYDCDEGGKLGLDLDAWKNSLGGQVQFTGNLFQDRTLLETSDGSFGRFDALLTLDARVLADFLNFTVQEGSGEVITRTNITATNQRLATVSSLKRIGVQSYITTFGDAKVVTEKVPGVSAGGVDLDDSLVRDRTVLIQPPSRSVLADQPGPSEGVVINIRPVIGSETVTADFNVVIISHTGFSKQGAPIVTERVANTRMSLRDCQPITLGSFDKYTFHNTNKGVPGLKDVPGLRRVFAVENEVIRRSKVFIVVTPRFVNHLQMTHELLSSTKPGEIEEPLGIAPNPGAAFFPEEEPTAAEFLFGLPPPAPAPLFPVHHAVPAPETISVAPQAYQHHLSNTKVYTAPAAVQTLLQPPHVAVGTQATCEVLAGVH